jgi:hypothetical protein
VDPTTAIIAWAGLEFILSDEKVMAAFLAFAEDKAGHAHPGYIRNDMTIARDAMERIVARMVELDDPTHDDEKAEHGDFLPQ